VLSYTDPTERDRGNFDIAASLLPRDNPTTNAHLLSPQWDRPFQNTRAACAAGEGLLLLFPRFDAAIERRYPGSDRLAFVPRPRRGSTVCVGSRGNRGAYSPYLSTSPIAALCLALLIRAMKHLLGASGVCAVPLMLFSRGRYFVHSRIFNRLEIHYESEIARALGSAARRDRRRYGMEWRSVHHQGELLRSASRMLQSAASVLLRSQSDSEDGRLLRRW